jgi:SH3 domain-containing protein
MRHLYYTGREQAPSPLRSSGTRSARIVRAVLVASLAAAMPLRGQKALPPVVPPPSNDSYNVTATSALRDAPSSAIIGELRKGTNVDVIARDRGWVRVRFEGWIPDSVLTPADTTYRSGLSAADLRADPDGARGKMVVWNVEFLALQTADPLRHGLADEEPYILARGPNSENALLYLVVPPSLMGTARALQPLAKITVTARVRDGRSEPVGIPILDIQTIRRIR